jgi:predicted  nucleic acid-binding Zn-ribbon protein
MTMEEMFENLRELQDVLSQKFRLERDIEEIPKQLSTQDELLSRYKKIFIETNERYDEVKLHLADCKNRLAEAERARETAEKNMETAQTQREYEARDKEIHDAADKEQQYRKELQKLEQDAVDLNERGQENEKMITEQEQDLSVRRENIKALQAEKQAELVQMAASEKKLTSDMDSELLFKFDRIIRNKGGKGIVAIKGGVCTGCHMILPAQFSNNVRSGEEIVFCPYCSRILYHEELSDGEENYFDDEGLGSLADLDDLGEEEDDEDGEETEDEAVGGEFEE